MNEVTQITLDRFILVYLLLLVVLAIMKKAEIKHTRLLVSSSLRMTLQLVLAGFLLTAIFKNPQPIFTISYLLVMIVFSIYQVYKRNPDINKEFKKSIAFSISLSGLAVIFFFVVIVVNEDFFNPQYVIPISGMLMGNAMTGVNLAVKTFNDSLKSERLKIETLINIGANPKDILLPFVNQALETAILPTLNRMVGMGIVSLPGMMTGQILSGTVPTVAILYQIAIMIAITTIVCLAVFSSLYFGYRSLYNDQDQIIWDYIKEEID
mgnify:CR=1 FL=1